MAAKPASQPPPITAELQNWLEGALDFKKYPLAKLVSEFERRDAASHAVREAVLGHLSKLGEQRRALIVGITGTPGAGKSSLIAAVTEQLLAQHQGLRVAVLAVDPSSAISGGALLGDRTRLQSSSSHPRLFFRSQASNLELGGIVETTFHACRILRHLADIILIETVGVGQSETEISSLTDHTALVMQPLAGDAIQFMKCGIMELPDSFIINKCDEEQLARQSHEWLRASLKTARLQQAKPAIFLSSTVTGQGIEALSEALIARRENIQRLDWAEVEQTYLQRWLARLWGSRGVARWQESQANPNNEPNKPIPKQLISEPPIAYEQQQAAITAFFSNLFAA